MQLTIGKKIKVTEINDYDHSVILLVENKKIHISREVANNLLIAL
jgi:DtxR family Mn-dependent transcriptional regulator